MNIEDINNKIRRNSKLKPSEKLIVCVNRSCSSMLEDAWLLTAEGEMRGVFWESSMGGDQADEAAVRLTEDGPEVLAFHESRPSSRDGRPDGICVHHGELDFPCAVFYNCGSERLTVDGEWVEPGEYTSIQELDLNSPEVQQGSEKARRAYAEK